jgi:hypothetical protein
MDYGASDRGQDLFLPRQDDIIIFEKEASGLRVFYHHMALT